MVIIKKEDINILLDTLVKTTSEQDPSGKLTDILKLLLKTDDIRIIRSTLLLWLDTMSILNYDRLSGVFGFNKPTWFLCAEKEKFILLGALTTEDIDALEKLDVKKNQKNTIQFKNYLFELPDSYYSYNIDALKGLGFAESKIPLFFDTTYFPNVVNVIEKLFSGKLSIINNQDESICVISFIKDETYASEYILSQDTVETFDWISRNFIRSLIEKEIEDPMGIKLLKVTKKRGGIGNQYFETFTLLLEREGNDWRYTFFDKSKIDERWARLIYLSKIKYYDLHKEFRNREIENYGYLFNNILKYFVTPKEETRELNLEIGPNWRDTNEVLKIPEIMRHQFIRYDKINQILAVPATLPLPQTMLKSLFSCSGLMPYFFTNKFRVNPKYILKLLFAGALAEESHYLNYPEEPYYIEEVLHLYRCVPPELASILFDSLNISICYETFYQKI
jgi:hypothetical protein